jgi:hypothetical protein
VRDVAVDLAAVGRDVVGVGHELLAVVESLEMQIDRVSIGMQILTPKHSLKARNNKKRARTSIAPNTTVI